MIRLKLIKREMYGRAKKDALAHSVSSFYVLS